MTRANHKYFHYPVTTGGQEDVRIRVVWPEITG